MKKFFEKITNKWLLKGTTTIILVAIVIACYIGLNWGVEKLNLENLDLTSKKLYSLSDETRTRLKHLEGDITIQLINLKDYASGYVDGNYVIDYAKKYSSASDKVKIEEDYIAKTIEHDDGIEFIIDIRKIEINEFVKLVSSQMSIIDLDIDRGDIDELIVKLYEDFKI